MTGYPLTLEEILSWYRSKERTLTGLANSVDIFERREYAPAAAADFTGNDTMGRINGWVSGEFDFEALRISDGKDLYSRHVDVSKLQELEPAYSEFVQHLIRAE